MSFKYPFLFLSLILAGFLVTFSSCKKEEDRLKEEIVGTWNVTSYMDDGVELMGDEYTIFRLTFEAYEGNIGGGEWKIVSETEFGSIDFEFPLMYSIQGETIELMGEPMDLEIVNNTMTMSGMVDLDDEGELSDVKIVAQRQ